MEVTDETDGDVPGNPEDAILREGSKWEKCFSKKKTRCFQRVLGYRGFLRMI
jgi:hypothetical protein